MKLSGKYDITKIALILGILVLLSVINRMYNENQMLKSRLGTTYHYAVGGVLASAYRDLDDVLQKNNDIDANTMAIYATQYKLNYETLQIHYPQWNKVPEIRDFAWQLYRKTQEVTDSLENGVYEEIPTPIREELIEMVQAGKETFMALYEPRELQSNYRFIRRDRNYKLLHRPSQKAIKIIKEGLTPVLTN